MGILKDIETFLLPPDTLADDGIPSVSVAYLDNPSASLQSNTIARSRENTETLYQACSISKAITALAVAKLVDRGELSYDSKIVEYIPRPILDSIGSEHLMQHVTVGKLLSHTSGLSQHGFPGYAGDRLPTYEEVFAGRSPANTPRVRFSSFPGSEMSYSGAGYTLLQIFLEKFTGLEFSCFMRQTVLEPLGMTRSLYGQLPPEETNYARAHFTADILEGTDTGGRGYHRFTELAAAGLWTTPSELLKATRAIQISLHPVTSQSSQPFLCQQTAWAMLNHARPSSSDVGRQIGMGWFSDSTFFAHAGDNDPGYTCYLIACHSVPAVIPGDLTNRPSGLLFNLAIMTNSTLGRPMIKKILLTLFAMKQIPLYQTLPGISSMTDVVPLLAPEGINFPGWEVWIGHWEDDWEIYDDEGFPMVAWDGLEMPHRLLLTASPMPIVDGVRGFFFKIEGVEMGIRLVPGVDGDRWIEIIGKEVKVLRPLNAHIPGPQWPQRP